jgi:hypothetical protein
MLSSPGARPKAGRWATRGGLNWAGAFGKLKWSFCCSDIFFRMKLARLRGFAIAA